jgi:hypothetical protein
MSITTCSLLTTATMLHSTYTAPAQAAPGYSSMTQHSEIPVISRWHSYNYAVNSEGKISVPQIMS